MKGGRYSISRQKACLPCSTAKAKCDRKAGRCGRCTLRGLSCDYPRAVPSADLTKFAKDNVGARLQTGSASALRLPSPESELPTGVSTGSPTVESTQSIGSNNANNASSETFIESPILRDIRLDGSNRLTEAPETPDFSDMELFSGLELFCPIDANDIKNRWLNSFVPVAGQKVKEYPASVSAFIYRILKSYAAVAVHGRGVPPFVHASQMTAAATRRPLSTCLTLVRICEKPLPGSESVAADVLQREMNNLYEQHGTYDDLALLAAFQAYLIYSMVLFFRLEQGSTPFLRQAMMSLQDLACSSSGRGLMCTVEQQRTRPRWEAWIVAEAKRRALFTMYMFDSVLSTQDGLPTFLGIELEGLPAPANRSLWGAYTRHQWETEYNIHQADWPEGGLRIDELWPIPAELDDDGLFERRRRVDQWLENIDEFGTMMYAVTSCTHGG